jgi:Uma2 family endonuclease
MSTLSVEEYLKREREAQFRSEYLRGEVFAMAGGSLRHALIVAGVQARLEQQLRDKPCAVVGSDARLYCAKERMFTYPDAFVLCSDSPSLDDEDDTFTDTPLIVEVLSKSTRNYDRGEKFRCYRSLPSFREYLLLEQDAIQAEHYVRQPDGSWLMREWTGADTVVRLESIGCELRLGDVYAKTTLVTTAPATP